MSASWLNSTEVFFLVNNGWAIRCGTFRSVAALVAVRSFFSRRRVIASSGRRCWRPLAEAEIG
jgi:hypothetical protein